MGFRTGYKYDENTKQFLRLIDCQQSQQTKGIWLMPSNTTFVQLIQTKEGKARVFDEQKQEWNYVVDNRNKTMYLKQKSLTTATTPNGLFDQIPSDYTLVQPPDHQKWYKFKNKKWVYYFDPVKKQDLYELTYNKKTQVCYGGIILIKDDIRYKFQTTQDAINFGNSTIIRLSQEPEGTIVNWKMWKEDNSQPVIMELTKQQFQIIYTFSLNMVNNTFQVEGSLNNDITNMTEEDLASQTKFNEFKEKIETEFAKVDRQIQFTELV